MVWSLPILTGLLFAASFPRIDQGYLAWIAFIPLVVFMLKVRTRRRAFFGGFLSGAMSLSALMIWIPAVLTRYGELPTALAWAAFALMIAMLACYPAVACALTKHLVQRGGDAYILAFPAVWIVMEYAQSLSPFGGLPWNLAGYSQSAYLSLIQFADIAGVFGVSFLLLWTNTALVWFVYHRGARIACAPLAAALLMIGACFLYGGIMRRHWENATGQYRAAILQGNISYEDPEPILSDMFRRGYVQMADRLGPGGAHLLVLPESPTPVAFQYDASYRTALEELSRRFSFGLIFNNIRSVETDSGWNYFNSAYFLDGSGWLTGIYDKIHLVPFGEYIPLKKLFFFAETITKDVGEFRPGKDYRIVEVGRHPANAIICFEAVFPDLVRRFVNEGSRLIVNLTNDGWYGNSSAPYQHFAIARFRAIENRRYLIRAANTGISAVIEPSGKVQSPTNLLQEAVSRGTFSFIEKKTLYTRYGNVLVFLCAIILCAVWIFTEFHRTTVHK
jgi:apolipoprotein N-acyltransferase